MPRQKSKSKKSDKDIDFKTLMEQQALESMTDSIQTDRYGNAIGTTQSLEVDIDSELTKLEESEKAKSEKVIKKDYSANILNEDINKEGKYVNRSDSRLPDINDPDGYLKALEDGIITENPNEELNAILNQQPLLEEYDNAAFIINSMYNMQRIVFDITDHLMFTTGVVTKKGLTEKMDLHREGYANCYAGILKKYGHTETMKLLTDPISQLTFMSAGLVLLHIEENKPKKE